MLAPLVSQDAVGEDFTHPCICVCCSLSLLRFDLCMPKLLNAHTTVSQGAVGDLLGNMGGAGMRNMNADRRRHRIMQSRGTRALGEGPQAAAAIASGPAAQFAQHRYLLASTSSGKQF